MQFLHSDLRIPHYGGDINDSDAPIKKMAGWRQWPFIRSFRAVPGAEVRFPKTKALLASMAELNDIVHASFLILEPGAELPLHADGLAWCYNYQLGVLVPDGSSLTVDGEIKEHRPREALIFNDSFLHSAANQSNSVRTLLNVNVAHPCLSLSEVEGLRQMVTVLPRNTLTYPG